MRYDLRTPLQPPSRGNVPTQAQEFTEEFISALSTVCPDLLIQFEDFASTRVFSYLSLFRTRYRMSNDAIQGSSTPGTPREGHWIVSYGAGNAGIGIAMVLMGFFTEAWNEEERRARFWTVDSQGLIYEGHDAWSRQ